MTYQAKLKRPNARALRQYAYFDDLPLKTEFVHNGNLCRKRSSATADLGIDQWQDNWFYYGGRTLVEVGLHDRLAPNYFSEVLVV